MRLIRIKVERGITCSTTLVSCWRRNNFISSSLMQRNLPDASESSLAEREETVALRDAKSWVSLCAFVKMYFSLCTWVYKSIVLLYNYLTGLQPQASHFLHGLRCTERRTCCSANLPTPPRYRSAS